MPARCTVARNMVQKSRIRVKLLQLGFRKPAKLARRFRRRRRY